MKSREEYAFLRGTRVERPVVSAHHSAPPPSSPLHVMGLRALEDQSALLLILNLIWANGPHDRQLSSMLSYQVANQSPHPPPRFSLLFSLSPLRLPFVLFYNISW